ncbi:MAG: RNA polymerase sigma factor [Bacteroidales bacterium]
MNQKSEHELLSRLKEPESRNAAFRELVGLYQERIYWHVRRMIIAHEDADDVVQNIFIRVFMHIERFRGESSLYTWIYRITVNEIYSFLNALKKRNLISFDSVASTLEKKMTTDDFFSGDQIQMKFQKAVLKLPEKQRLVFNMKYYDEELTFEKLSGILDTSEGALKASYHHAVKKIEKMLRED